MSEERKLEVIRAIERGESKDDIVKNEDITPDEYEEIRKEIQDDQLT